MASIRGISVDQYVESETDRGMYFMGHIIMDGVKVGIFENEGEGGGTDFHFDNEEYKAEFERRVTLYFTDHPATLNDNEGFILEVLDLMDAEKQFIKRSQQLNRPFILIQANTYGRTSTLDDITEVATTYYTIFNESELQPLLQTINPVEHFVYRQLQDFVK
jgi:hypothetical protein